MAQLSSPGVAVTVIDESFYTPAAPGTTPLIIVASAENKQNGAGTGIARGTLKSNAGQVFLLTSQKDLADTFGTPVFKTDANNNPVHAGEQNEYGLQAAYSYLGVSNRVFAVRADLDVAQLDAKADAPAGLPTNGTHWFDTDSSKYGIFEWNSASAALGGQTFNIKYPTVITATNKVTDDVPPAPKGSVGAIGDYAIVATTTTNRLWFKNRAGSWVEVGTADWSKAWPVVQGSKVPALATGVGGADIGKAITFGPDDQTTFGPPITLAQGDSVSDLVANIINAEFPGITAGVDAYGHLEIYLNGTVTDEVYIGGTLTAVSASASVIGVKTGTYNAPKLQISKHTVVPEFKLHDEMPRPTGSVWFKTTEPNHGASLMVKRYNSATGAWEELSTKLYPNGQSALAGLDSSGGGINLAAGTLYAKTNDTEMDTPEADFKLYRRKYAGKTIITSGTISLTMDAEYSFTINESVPGSTDLRESVISWTGNGDNTDADKMADQINIQVGQGSNIQASVANGKVVIQHLAGGDIRLFDDTGTPLSHTGFVAGTTTNLYQDPSQDGPAYMIASNWEPLSYTAGGDAPTTTTADGQLWYNSVIDEVDIMIHNGTTWVGYNNFDQTLGDTSGSTDPMGPTVSATAPTTQQDGTTALANGDLWIDTSDLENFPMIYKYNYPLQKWALVDNSDQSTEEGVLFHDARWNMDGMVAESSTIVELLDSDFLDPDAPDPALYPKGMLLWNLRRSGFNVKKFVRNYIDPTARNHRQGDEHMTDYYPHRWLSEAANQEDGSGTFGRKAQRKVVVQALQALVNSNQQIRDEESRIFNLIATPGYPELVGEMVNLNYDRGLTAFVVADTPARLQPDATSLLNWGTNQNGALEDNDKGLVTSDEYLGFFYPWGYTSDNLGNNVVVPPSHMMLRTIALSDNVSYPWFAPAGTRRGGITNASAVGYITSEGEFQSVALNTGQRDTLAQVKVNPLTFITGTGLVNYGQYTRARNASALDRINVARLVIYLRRQFAQLAKPYIFEPNDKITRDEIKQAAESLLLELVGQRALYDFLVVCDTSNNTPSRIDRSELYLDVAIEPVKAVEFIYIPLRLKNTGEIKGLGA
jgi:hypothetical protein